MTIVFKGLSTLCGIKTVGPGVLFSIFLYQLRSIKAFPLFLIFWRSLDEGIFPSILKLSSVTPIHKSDNKSNITNYRPISIQCHISKLFESLVLKSIKPSLNNILIEKQHGFRSGRSTTTYLYTTWFFPILCFNLLKPDLKLMLSIRI